MSTWGDACMTSRGLLFVDKKESRKEETAWMVRSRTAIGVPHAGIGDLGL